MSCIFSFWNDSYFSDFFENIKIIDILLEILKS